MNFVLFKEKKRPPRNKQIFVITIGKLYVNYAILSEFSIIQLAMKRMKNKFYFKFF